MVRPRTIVLLSLCLLAVCAVAALQAPPFEDEIRRFEAGDKLAPPAEGSVLFVGSSSIRLWTTLARDFPEYRTLNRGFGGSQIADSTRNADRIVTPYKPEAIVFFAGTNDLASGKTPETVRRDYEAFVTRVRAKLAHVPIAFISITPAPSRWANIANVRKANELVKAYTRAHKNLYFIDVFPLMLDAKGGPRPDLFVDDQLHMKPEGYAIWTREVRKVLREMRLGRAR